MTLAATLLIYDANMRVPSSHHAQAWKTHQQRLELFKVLVAMHVPPDIAEVIKTFAPIRDPQRPRLEFFPSMGGFSPAHDIGRLIPPQIFFTAHNLLAQVRTNQEISEIYRLFTDTVIINCGANATYTVSNLIGDRYLAANQPILHQNWINIEIEKLFSPCVARAKLARPTYGTIPIFKPEGDFDDINPYDFMLNFSQADCKSTIDAIRNISEFVANHTTGSTTLGSILVEASGYTILTHTLEQPTLPTHHKLPAIQAVQAGSPRTINNTDFAAFTNFLVAPAALNTRHNMPVLGAQLQALYQMRNTAHVAANLPYTYARFNEATSVYPNVAVYQPFKTDPNSIAHALILGLKIEQDTIDGITIPLPQPENEPYENNSNFHQGAIPIAKIMPVIMNNDAANAIRVVKRDLHPVLAHPIGFALRDMSQSIVPVFNTLEIQAHCTIRGLVNELHHTTPAHAFTATAWNSDATCTIPDSQIYLWSSYRYIKGINHRNRVVYFWNFWNVNSDFKNSKSSSCHHWIVKQ
jgi:hypothetical protein